MENIEIATLYHKVITAIRNNYSADEIETAFENYIAGLEFPTEEEERRICAAAEAHQPQPFQVIANLTRKLGDAIKALREIEKGEGPYKRDPLQHAENVIGNMKRIAREALRPYEPRPEEPDGPDPCDLARDFNDALRDADQPTPYDEAKYRP